MKERQNQAPGETPDIETIYRRYGVGMYRYALALLGRVDYVEEVVQEVFVKLVRYRKRLIKARSPKAYVMAMVRHEIFRRLRRHPAPVTFDPSLLEAREEHGVSAEDARTLEKALAKLPAEQREVVIMKQYEGMSFQEVAKIIGCPAATAASRYRYAIEKLRNLLAGYFEDDQ